MALKKRESLSLRKRRLRKQRKHNLKLLNESFSAEPREKIRICRALGIGKMKWLLYLKNKDRFLEGEKNFKTLNHVEQEWKTQEFGHLSLTLYNSLSIK